MGHFPGVPAVPRPHLRDPKLEQFWRDTVAKWTASGLNIREFCRTYELTEPSFDAWRREVASRDQTPVAKSVPRATSASPAPRTSEPRPSRPAPRRTARPNPRPSFVALRVVPDTPLELVLRSGHVLRVPPGYDAAHLRAVVAALEAAPC